MEGAHVNDLERQVDAGVRAAPPAFEPRARHWKYFFALQEVLAVQGARATDQELSTRLGVTRQAIWKMRQEQGFAEWLEREIRRLALKGGLSKLLCRCLELGLRGSIKHAEFFAKYSGEAPATNVAAMVSGGAAAVAMRSRGTPAINLILGVPLTPPPPVEGEEPFIGVPQEVVNAGLVPQDVADKINVAEAERRRTP